jgi:integrase/recombinase XerD
VATERFPTRAPERFPSRAPSGSARSGILAAVETWLADGWAQGFSERTLAWRRAFFERLEWWLLNEDKTGVALEDLTTARIRSLLSYCREAQSGGRFGCAHPVARRKARPSTVQTYYRDIRAFLNFCVQEGLLDENPMRNIKPPRVPCDQVQPFTAEQVQSLLDAAVKTSVPERNRTILLLLADTGLCASELCGLTIGNAASPIGEVTVAGKGGKRRLVYMGTAAQRALRGYVHWHRRRASDG